MEEYEKIYKRCKDDLKKLYNFIPEKERVEYFENEPRAYLSCVTKEDLDKYDTFLENHIDDILKSLNNYIYTDRELIFLKKIVIKLYEDNKRLKGENI